MAEYQLVAKTTALIANSTVSLVWSGADFAQAIPGGESIIKKQVALRLTCSSTTVTNGVFVGARYTTLDKNYQLSERLTIGTIPAGGSVELTAASIPAFGRLFENIVSLTIALTAPVGGTVTVQPIIDDSPPPLAADVGARIGLDAAVASNDVVISFSAIANVAAGANSVTVLYTVPAGKRFIWDTLFVGIEPTPSYPGQLDVAVNLTVAANNVNIQLHSDDEEYKAVFVPPITMALLAGDYIAVVCNNNSATLRNVDMTLLGREIF